jgi:ribulose-phosphate 3-epimerase
MIEAQPISLISASILAADFRHLEKDILAAESAGVDHIHIDVMDGVFVPNISMGPMIVETCRKITNLPLDVHLMIINPEKYIEVFQEAGANRISIHIEQNPIVNDTLQRIQKMGCTAGLVINPETPLQAIGGSIAFADFFLLMTVHPGFGGQNFMDETLPKISSLRDKLESRGDKKLIQVDGGISSQTAPACFQAGARDFVAGNSIFNHPGGILAGVKDLREAIK